MRLTRWASRAAALAVATCVFAMGFAGALFAPAARADAAPVHHVSGGRRAAAWVAPGAPVSTAAGLHSDAAASECYAQGGCYDYAGVQLNAGNQGATATFAAQSPSEDATSSHSLVELAVDNFTAQGDVNDSAEVGWTASPTSPAPQMFVYHFDNTAATCYNGCGFVSTSQTITPGMTLTPGAQVVWTIRQIDGQWTFYFNGVEFGYFPASAYQPAFSAAAQANVFGEVASNSAPGCSQMGTGSFAAAPGSETVTHFGLFGAARPAGLQLMATTNPAAYTAQLTGATSARLGGPGLCDTSPPAQAPPAAAPTQTSTVIYRCTASVSCAPVRAGAVAQNATVKLAEVKHARRAERRLTVSALATADLAGVEWACETRAARACTAKRTFRGHLSRTTTLTGPLKVSVTLS
jgi:Neprosin